jgi:predicted MFS family arabinose efflux permease
MSIRHHPAMITAAVYALSVFAMATVGAVVPFMARYATELSVSKSAIGLAIALFSVPTALLATIGGGIVDRVGLRPSLIASAVLMIGGDVIAYGATSVAALYAGMLLSGAGYGIVAVGAPAMLMASTEGKARTRAMSFWSTYAPTGFAVGLLIAAPFADGMHWREVQLFHAGLLVAAMVFALITLPSVKDIASLQEREPTSIRGLLAVCRDIRLLRLALAAAIPNAISYGTSLVTPSYFADVHHVSLAASASSVAFAKIFAMMLGGVVVGHLLVRGLPGRSLFVGIILMGMVAQTLIYLPASPFLLAIAALIVWLFAFGGISGTTMALLPTLVADPRRSAAASGVVNQAISIFSFLTPSLYFSFDRWSAFVGLALAGLAICIFALPIGRRPQTAVIPPSTTREVPEM